MNNKAFFSTVILIFVLLIFSFYIVKQKENYNLKFDDSYRYFALKTEEAYALLDKNLATSYLDNVDMVTCVEKTPFKNYIETNFTDFKLNEFCKVNSISSTNYNSGLGTPRTYIIDVVMFCSYNSKDKSYNYILEPKFKKSYINIKYQNVCSVNIYDVDSGMYYYS